MVISFMQGFDNLFLDRSTEDVAYKAKPKESKKFQGRMDELVDKGFIKESPRPCFMNILWMIWRIFMDGQVIYTTIVEYSHSIPNLDDILDKWHGST